MTGHINLAVLPQLCSAFSPPCGFFFTRLFISQVL